MYQRILELYSGIGGMHCAWKESNVPGEIVLAVDINTVANEVYKHNFPGTKLLNRNIQSLTPEEINKLNVNTILMSPPCQPFTRNGKFMDDNDPRTNSFIHLIQIIDKLVNINFILMENVKGFECSSVRNMFVEKLRECKFQFQEFLLCPSSIGIPNSRQRYYCVASRESEGQLIGTDEIMTNLPHTYPEPHCLGDIIETNVSEDYLVPDKLLKRAKLFDICYRGSRRSCCITKAYSHYVEGTGSVFTETEPDIVDACYEMANNFEVGSDKFVKSLKDLKLRFFTPNEVLSLMAFPKCYNFPQNITIKQCYRLLGNSVNVRVISELIKILFKS